MISSVRKCQTGQVSAIPSGAPLTEAVEAVSHDLTSHIS